VSRVVVIGAGVGGLAAAARLGALGHQVSVYEQSTVVGGKLGRLERDTGTGTFRFDTGPGLLTLPQVFAELFAATGSTMDSELELVALDPVVRHVFADGTRLDLGGDAAALADRIGAALGPVAAADWRRLWRRAERVWSASWRHILRSPVDGRRDTLRLAWRLRELAAVAPGRTLRGLGHGLVRDPRLRVLLDRYATYTGSDPRSAPAALVAIAYAELAFGGWYVRGGLAGIADALLRRCEALGVDVHCGQRVTRIETAGGRARGVRLDDGSVAGAELVVANADAYQVYADLLRMRPGRQLAQRSSSGFALLLGVRGATPELAHHTVFYPPRYDDEFDALFARRGAARPVDDPAILVTRALDDRVAPAGHEAWFVLVNAAPSGRTPSTVDWRRPGVAESYADHVLARLAARGPDVRDRVLFREVISPAELAQRSGAGDGAIYGSPSHRLLRPPSRTPVRGLYLVGGSTHPGGGLPMVALSAQILAGRIGPAS
jgi:phytoene desaturase